ncbi:pentapeptide repeat-containing protein [Microbacterium sp. 1P10UB]|uniref:pentapeptide repeat-containing protein n=1 Tax=unclassified Microbacterium TaxID=2609290 RepID=UPI0039A047F6
MPQRPALMAPSFDALVLNDLAPGRGDDLRPRAALEGVSFTDMTLDAVDLESAELTACRISGLRASTLSLGYAHLSELAMAGVDAPIWTTARGTWRDVEVGASRSGSIEAYESSWNGVHFRNCRLGFVNLRGSSLQNVAFTDCIIDELDVGQTKITRFAATATRIGRLLVEQSTLQHVDLRGADLSDISGSNSLRGATISSSQLAQLAPLLAADRGIDVSD